MHRTLQISSRDVTDCISKVDRDRARLRGHISPVPILAQDLQPSDRLAKEQRYGPEIGVAAAPAEAARFVLLGGAFVVDHIPEVILAPLLIRMLLNQVFLIRQLQHNRKQSQQGQYHICMQRFVECLNLIQMRLYEIRMMILALEILGELGEIVHLDIIPHNIV